MGGTHQQIRGSADRDEAQRVTTRPVRRAGPGARAPRLTISMAMGIDATSRTTMKPSASRKRSPRASRNTSTIPHSRNDRICGAAPRVRAAVSHGCHYSRIRGLALGQPLVLGNILTAAGRRTCYPAGAIATSPSAYADEQALSQMPPCIYAVPVTRCQSHRGGSGACAGRRPHA